MKLENYLEQPAGWAPGIYELKSYEQYAAIKALRSSQLKLLKKSPAHYRAAIEHPKPRSPQMEKILAKGKAFDTLILHGPEKFEKLVTVEPDLNRNTKVYKAWKLEHADAKCLLSEAEKKQILAMSERAFSKNQFSHIFGQFGFSHRVIIWQDARTGIWCKCEIDWIMEDGTVVDLKSTADAGFWFFGRNARRLGYFNQGAFYLEGLTAVTGIVHDQFLLAAVEVDPPHESHVFRVSQDQLDRAKLQNDENISALKHCFETDSWPGYPDLIMDLDSGQYDDEIYYEDEMMEDESYGF